ncbi:basic leucine zipper and W2 domain-containing protein 1-like [Gigantopelta aegis]|uniref:basic leucine zipper and W2 domain-containing protein 1-like n=1 Tax=Gigantopelta aegis TaxID=1735272 RepID=UPI001B88D519|nr:basic leucine zipper and W2 domain-containing protein 1-like [Gigantopelta aegis]XP_041371417.1 basic leucine zipper and W2 domain-containing protein 1-like [Gigantopelta aegis]XP_041371418.1 basic leucine zipper and W2 domain-containing protein 1-like [Gigantopelta aegis]
MSNQKVEKPSLSGTRLKTRKRDEKEKYDPLSFRDTVVQGLNETECDLEKVSKYLDVSSSRLNYRRYAEVLFDVLIAGGYLAPGGSIVQDPEPTKICKSDICVFSTEENKEKLKLFYEVLYKLIRRYKYLEKPFEDNLKKIIVFLKGYKEDERKKLAIITGIILSQNLCTAKVLSSLFEEHLIKEGLSLEFTTLMFRTWLEEKDINSVWQALKKSQIDSRLMELFPANKRSLETFNRYFREAGLDQIAEMQSKQVASVVRKTLHLDLAEMLKEDKPAEEVSEFVVEQMVKYDIPEHEVAILIWNNLMEAIEWNKKEELVTDQAMKHLKAYTPLFVAVVKTNKSEMSLMLRIQEYCYENMNFLKSFQKIVILLYKTNVLSEDTIVNWYKKNHSPKGKSVFLEQMKKFVEWLENAEEESEEDDD